MHRSTVAVPLILLLLWGMHADVEGRMLQKHRGSTHQELEQQAGTEVVKQHIQIAAETPAKTSHAVATAMEQNDCLLNGQYPCPHNEQSGRRLFGAVTTRGKRQDMQMEAAMVEVVGHIEAAAHDPKKTAHAVATGKEQLDCVSNGDSPCHHNENNAK